MFIDVIVAKKNLDTYVCCRITDFKWKCGCCAHGNIFVIKAKQQGYTIVTKKCAVCKAKIKFYEIES